MIYKKILSLILLFTLMLSCTTALADESDTTSQVNPDIKIQAECIDNEKIKVTCNVPMYGIIKYKIQNDDGDIDTNTSSIDCKQNTEIEIGLPVRQLPPDNYYITIQYYLNDECISSTVATAHFGTGDITIAEPRRDIERMKCVLTSYAKVYSSKSLTGKAIAELKLHDLVQIIQEETEDNKSVYKVRCQIQSGDGEIIKEDEVNAKYESDNDVIIEGYMDKKAFELPTNNKYATDIQREVIEIAYTRLGSKGIYSQNKRFTDYYVDCSALASWCWRQVGVDMSAYGTNCNGLAKWAESQSDNKILWKAREDYEGAQSDVWGEIHKRYDRKNKDGKRTHPHGNPVWFNGYSHKESALTKYTTHINKNIIDEMQAGDLVFFNYSKEQIDDYGHRSFGEYAVNESGKDQGYDHIALFVGERNGNMILIEATDPEKNTVVNQISISDTNETIKDIVLVVRPTGCEQKNIEGKTTAAYSGTVNSNIDDLEFQAPVPSYESCISSNFGEEREKTIHHGIDIAVALGTEIFAAADGEIIETVNICKHKDGKSCSCGAYGNYVKIQHSNSVITLYGHLSIDTITVKAGDKIKAGDIIGYSGSSGNSTGPHLHFELRNGKDRLSYAIDPKPYISNTK